MSDMKTHLTAYVRDIDRRFRSGAATEHTYRPALQTLLEGCAPGVLATNEPKQIECGAPDFVLSRGDIPLGYVEAKDLVSNLDDSKHQEQLHRYAESLDNLIFTDYAEFRLFRNGKKILSACIAETVDGRVKSIPRNFDDFIKMYQAFINHRGRTIKTAADLAERMAARTNLLADAVTQSLEQDEAGVLQEQLKAFCEYLIADTKPVEFADLYAQTVAYGMFAARMRDPSPGTFSRREAAELIPVSNPFLRGFFQHIAGFDPDEGIRWIVDDLADLFRATDVHEIMKDYGKTTRRNDPFIHFYETFLGRYKPDLRTARGVYYTPKPVVDFIIRATDDILRSEFGLRRGLANTKKIPVDIEGSKRKKKTHQVQILDPATGTGTFLAAIVRHIYDKYFTNQQGAWPSYVREHLMPRLNGFEILMAPYAMAHIKLEMTLNETGYENQERPRVFLANSLEKYQSDIGPLFAQWITREANEANAVKRDAPVMVVIGNPPYKGESSNKGKWISDLIEEYKQEPNRGKLEERNPKWINDDYIKFIRYGQYYIDRTGEGVLAYINNHGFLDSPTFRGVRWRLLQSFDKIYVLDLHGNSMKKETASDGSADENVFDIEPGVSINLFVKTGRKSENDLATVFHYDLYGNRDSKYEFLLKNNLKDIGFTKLKLRANQYYFVPKDYKFIDEYRNGISVKEMFPESSAGIVTARDAFTIHHTSQDLRTAISKFRAMDDETARKHFNLGPDVKEWKIHLARSDLENYVYKNDNDRPIPINWRPFDIRYTYYTGKSKGFHCRPRKIMRHFIEEENIGICICRQVRGPDNYSHAFITKGIFESSLVSNKTSEIGHGIPLYLYPDPESAKLGESQNRKPNLNLDIVKIISDNLGLRFVPEQNDDIGTFSPIDLLDYVYAVLYSPFYRERYNQILKDDFPYVPYPADRKQFRELVSLGEQLRRFHILEHENLDSLITSYPENGNNKIVSVEENLDKGRIYINERQYFGGVPDVVWDFQIGAYCPAQKWLKDRKGRALNHEDIMQYQKIIGALFETKKLMEEIDRVIMRKQ